MKLDHRFVESFPSPLEPGILYVSMPYASTAHLCCCGCDSEVIAPLSPTDWTLSFDGETISLDPSIGNWSQPCRSHYWIWNNEVHWARTWSQQEVEASRTWDKARRDAYYERRDSGRSDGTPPSRAHGDGSVLDEREGQRLWWQRIKRTRL